MHEAQEQEDKRSAMELARVLQPAACSTSIQLMTPDELQIAEKHQETTMQKAEKWRLQHEVHRLYKLEQKRLQERDAKSAGTKEERTANSRYFKMQKARVDAARKHKEHFNNIIGQLRRKPGEINDETSSMAANPESEESDESNASDAKSDGTSSWSLCSMKMQEWDAGFALVDIKNRAPRTEEEKANYDVAENLRRLHWVLYNMIQKISNREKERQSTQMTEDMRDLLDDITEKCVEFGIHFTTAVQQEYKNDGEPIPAEWTHIDLVGEYNTTITKQPGRLA